MDSFLSVNACLPRRLPLPKLHIPHPSPPYLPGTICTLPLLQAPTLRSTYSSRGRSARRAVCGWAPPPARARWLKAASPGARWARCGSLWWGWRSALVTMGLRAGTWTTRRWCTAAAARCAAREGGRWAGFEAWQVDRGGAWRQRPAALRWGLRGRFEGWHLHFAEVVHGGSAQVGCLGGYEGVLQPGGSPLRPRLKGTGVP